MSDPASGTRKRLDHVDAMRPVKQVAVISTHAIIFLAPVTAGLARQNLLVFTHFSREAFLFVSACMLAYSYQTAERVELRHYVKRRFVAVGIPYLTWTVIYFFYVSLVRRSGFPYYGDNTHLILGWSGLHRLAHLTLVGYYHLYYLVVLIEFYVVFPLVLRAVRRAQRWHGRLILAALAAQVLYDIFWRQIFRVVVDLHLASASTAGFWESRAVTSYTFVLVSGIVVALHLDAVHDWICAHRYLILGFTGAAGLYAVLMDSWRGTGFAHRVLVPGFDPFSISVIPYNVGAILCVYLLGVYLVGERRSVRTRAVVASGAECAYGIYLSQLLWIPILVRVVAAVRPGGPWWITTFVAVVIVYLAGFAFAGLAARTPLARGLTGRGVATWGSLVPHWRVAPAPPAESYDDGPLDLTASD
ncbi:MAG: acyltransferase family protein [Acidimicrobiales bacterium]